MPSTLPSPSTRRPVRSARSLASPPDRSTGICPTPRKKALLIRPFSPRPVKYSDLARNVTFRGSGSGPKKWSENDRWFQARMAGPSRGTLSAPSAHGRNKTARIGPRIALTTQYPMPTCSHVVTITGSPQDGATWPGGSLPRPAPCFRGALCRGRVRRCGRAQAREDGHHASDAGGGALLPLRRQYRSPALPRVHRNPGVAAALGGYSRGRRADRLPPTAARTRHHLAGHGAYPVGGLVRGGEPGLRGTARARRRDLPHGPVDGRLPRAADGRAAR